MSAHHKIWETANIPVSSWDVSFNEDKTNRTKIARQWAKEFPRHYFPTSDLEEFRSDIGVGLLFVGKPGRGKTTLAVAIMQEVYKQYNKSIMFAPFYDYMNALMEMMRCMDILTKDKSAESSTRVNEAGKHYDSLVALTNRVKNSALVVLDDVGKEHKTNTGYAQDEFDRLLRNRFRRGLPTIITSNTPVEKWAGDYGDSMASFIKEAYLTVNFNNGDYR